MKQGHLEIAFFLLVNLTSAYVCTIVLAIIHALAHLLGMDGFKFHLSHTLLLHGLTKFSLLL